MIDLSKVKSIYKRRLLMLAHHLEKGVLGHEVFDFSGWNWTPDGSRPVSKEYDKKGCGTNGCAIGECPFAFPEHWHFLSSDDCAPLPLLKKRNPVKDYPTDSARAFFNLCAVHADYLFTPGGCEDFIQNSRGTRYEIIFGRRRRYLPGNATRQQVARRIRNFVKMKYK